MSFEDARHLLNRTGFGATPEEIKALSALEWEAAVDKLIAGVQTTPTTEPPYWVDEPVGGLFTLRLLALKNQRGEDVKLEREAIERKQENQQRARSAELKAWWWNEMIRTESPLTERMVLFWHNHFVSEIDTVNSPELIYQQNEIFRKHALGNFSELLMAATIDAAMIIYLDNNSNVKGNPNENFAREVMELFTLGEGQGYTEEDIKEAARAFTGWRVDNIAKKFVFEKNLHDAEAKTVLGKTGKFNGDDIVKILLEHPRTAEFVTEKMWTNFISGDMDEAAVKEMAKTFRTSNYDLKVLLKSVLMSDAFRGPANRGNMIKSPADLVVGSCRMFDTHPAQSYQISTYGKLLGQDLFSPPDVAGWKGGSYWIDANTLITRHQLSRLVLAKPDMQLIKRYEGELKNKKLASIRANREKREIERLLKSQKSLLDNVLGDDGGIAGFGAENEPDLGIKFDTTTLDKAVDSVLSNEVSPEELVKREFANAKAADLRVWIKEKGLTTESLQKILLPLDPVHPVDKSMDPTEIVAQLLLDPAFQLK
jgi:uncharacterized protein (DUF1800 family)